MQWLGLGAASSVISRLPAAGIPSLLMGESSHRATTAFDPDVELSLTAAPGEVAVLPGQPTRVWQFTGSVLKGPTESLRAMPGSWLGPTIRVQRGQRVRITFSNRLPEASIVHWHGLDVPFLMDGHPSLVIPSGADYVYEFEVRNRAGTYWYHPHPHMRTGHQVYHGLAGMFVVTDDEERALGLPSGEEELQLVLQDRRFDAQNQLVYLAGGMMDQMMGFLGDRLLVNGTLQPVLPVATRAYRLRVLNGSNARIYKLKWSDGTPLTVIGGDGGLLEAPATRRFLTLAPAQRADIIVDLSQHAVGTTISLDTAAYPAEEVSMTDATAPGMLQASAVPNGVARSLVALKVVRRERVPWILPSRLSTFAPEWNGVATVAARRVTIDFRRMQWFLSGRVFEMTSTAPEEQVAAGGTQVWELSNLGGMMGQPMAHPIHIHGPQFRILERRTAATGATTIKAGSIREGLFDGGWRDTILILPGETVRLQLHYTDFPGLYLYHCHILEHEDGGMMRNFKVS